MGTPIYSKELFKKDFFLFGFVCLIFYGTSTFMGYLISKNNRDTIQ